LEFAHCLILAYTTRTLSSTATEFEARLWSLDWNVQRLSYHDLATHLALLSGGHLFRERNIIMPVGTVKFFNADKGYGFIAPDGGGDDSFVHISAVQAAGMHSLDKEQRVNFEVEIGRNGKASAINLSSAD
jgi:CspA family cold shock protein